ncbi:hypothetical protein BD560DRAFT_429378 [Blakeslea trispora]|nr:hypothetical protein BD560DRAFT_429378 [Blakeslea trispora]
MNRQKSSQNGRQNDGQNTAKKQAKYGQKAGERAKSVITKFQKNLSKMTIKMLKHTSGYSQIQLRVSKFLEKRQNYMTNPKKKKDVFISSKDNMPTWRIIFNKLLLGYGKVLTCFISKYKKLMSLNKLPSSQQSNAMQVRNQQSYKSLEV